MDENNWHTNEAILRLDNDEYAHKTAWRVVRRFMADGMTAKDAVEVQRTLSALISEAYTFDEDSLQHDCVSWMAVLNHVIGCIKEHDAYIEAQRAKDRAG